MLTLALDCGQRTGFAYSDGESGTLDLTRYITPKSPDCDHGRACHEFRAWLESQTFDRLVTETAVFTGRKSLAGVTQAMLQLAYMVRWRRGAAQGEATAG